MQPEERYPLKRFARRWRDALVAAIGEWIARDNPARAEQFVAELIERAEALSDTALLYPPVAPRSFFQVRRVNYKGYRILYAVTGGYVTILHIHHGARSTPDFPG